VKSQRLQDLERPQRARRDRPRRRAIADDLVAGDVLETLLAGADVGLELDPRLRRDQAVILAVRGDLVAGVVDALHQPRMRRGDSAEAEDRRAHAVAIEQGQQRGGVGLHRRRARRLLRAGVVAMKPILEIDREEVLDVMRLRRHR